MFNRRTLFRYTLGAFFAFSSRSINAQEQTSIFDKLDADTLKKILRARTKAECDFVDLVDSLRKTGKLSERAVYAAYRYAMRHRTSSRCQYFIQSIRLFAKEEGVILPNVQRPVAQY
ncbi:MAG: hypothetical protein ACRC10_01225 [Thermoguttaceae bacterium]